MGVLRWRGGELGQGDGEGRCGNWKGWRELGWVQEQGCAQGEVLSPRRAKRVFRRKW